MTFLGTTTPYYGGSQVKNAANVIPTSGPPSANIKVKLGTLAVDNAAALIYGAASQVGGITTWSLLGGATGAVATLTGNSGGAISPAAGNIDIKGAGALAFSGAGSTLTGSITPGTALISTLTGDSGTATPVTGNVQIKGTTNQITATGAAAAVTLALAGPYTPATYTAHGVLLGESATSIVATSAGTNGQVLVGSTGADPAFSTITSAGGTLSFTLGATTLNIETTQAPLAVLSTAINVAAMAPNTVYICTQGAATLTLGIPTTGVVGQIFGAVSAGNNASSKFQFTQGAACTLHDVSASNTPGATGTATSNEQWTTAFIQVTAVSGGNITDVTLIYGRGTITLA